ncbi:MAG: transporter [Terriglobales bacterium]
MHSQRLTISTATMFLAATITFAQQSSGSTETPCAGTNAVSVTSRPTIANATDTTQCGVVELEYGLERQWPGHGSNRDDLSGGVRMGLTNNLDFHWSSADFLHVMDGSGNRTSFGDTWLGLKYRFLKQTKHRPSLGLFYAAKVPSASAALGLGSGEVDHTVSFLASKDLHRLHLDFNVIELLAGRTAGSGFDHNTGFALSCWLTVSHRVNLVVEPYGYTLLNSGSPAFASTMMGFNYRVQPRLYLDGGFDLGVTSAAPRERVFVGVTYALGNVYSWLRPQR